MDKIHFLQIYKNNSGLCNQLCALISSICYSIKYNKKIIIISEFLKSIHTNNLVPISEIININELNIFLKKYDILLIDKYFISLKILNIKYGSQDVTANFSITNKLFISKNTNFETFSSEINKKIYVNIELNNNIYEFQYEQLNGYPLENIIINLEEKYNQITSWNILDEPFYTNIFKEFLKNIKFSNKLNSIFSIENKIINEKYSNINVIHLRLENDAIEHWSKMNNMDHNNFRNIAINKYIDVIKKYIDKQSITIILSSSLDNPAIQFLKDNNYNIKMTNKYFSSDSERELNAIIDFLFGRLCNNVYIGPGNSTFTQFIIKSINNTKNILFNFDNINENYIECNRFKDSNLYSSDIKIPQDFDSNNYRILNKDLEHLSDLDATLHYLEYGIDEKRSYISKLPSDFKVNIYKNLNKDLEHLSDSGATLHYLEKGINEKRNYISNLPIDFNPNIYRNLNNDLIYLTNDIAILHYLNHGINEKREFVINTEFDLKQIPNDFNIVDYKKFNKDLNFLKNKELIIHYLKYGINEKRKYKN